LLEFCGDHELASQSNFASHLIEKRTVIKALASLFQNIHIFNQLKLKVSLVLPFLQKGVLATYISESTIALENDL